MPRYFFDITEGESFIRDDFGLELNDEVEARREAILLTWQISPDEVRDASDNTFMTQVRDADGTVIYQARMTLHSEWRAERKS